MFCLHNELNILYLFILRTYFLLCVCSARLAAAAGAGDHAGLKEEGKRDVITGKRFSNTNLAYG